MPEPTAVTVCVIHMLGGGPKPYPDAVYVLAGYSVCDDDRCLNAIGATHHETVMGARAIEWAAAPTQTTEPKREWIAAVLRRAGCTFTDDVPVDELFDLFAGRSDVTTPKENI